MHEPVLLQESLQALRLRPGNICIDGTCGSGGHAEEIIRRITPGGTLVCIDWDADALERTQKFLGSHAGDVTLIFINENFKNMKEILKTKKIKKADALFLDLGFSSETLGAGRGFSFLHDEPLSMTYEKNAIPLSDALQKISEQKLASIIREYGEERFAGRVASAIKKHLPILTSGTLARTIMDSLPKNYEHGRIHPATRTFQALRMFINNELENIREALMSIPEILNPGARVAVISFHSVEDRVVKESFRNLVKEKYGELINKKPIVPTSDEIQKNPRSRSAKLRAFQTNTL